jgi:hypothetical protein
MGKFAYSHSNDNLMLTAQSVTLTTGVRESTQYDVDKAYDGDPARPLKIIGTSMDLDMVWASPVLPIFTALLHSNISVVARLQGDNTNLNSPAVDVAFAVPTMSVDKWFTSPFLNLTGMGITAKSKWRIRVVSNALPVILGELWLGSAFRQLSDGIGFLLDDSAFDRAPGTVVHMTNHNVKLRYHQGPIMDSYAGSVIVKGTDLQAVHDWRELARGASRSFAYVFDVDVNDAQLVAFGADPYSRTPLGDGYMKFPLPIEAVSRGLQWIDPDA